MNNLVQIIDINTENVLFECPVKDIEQAYKQAHNFEEMGLEVLIQSPSITETLAHSLGKTGSELEEYNESVRREMDDHDCIDQ